MSQLEQFRLDNNLEKFNLHLGCGGKRFEGWINVDLYPFDNNDSSRCGADIDVEMDITNLDCSDNTVDNILLVHVFEHFVRWEGVELLQQFYRKLVPGGRVFLETPDLDKCIEIYLAGKKAPHMNTPLGPLNIGFTQFYGNQWDRLDYETHRYVWTSSEIKNVAQAIGFEIEECGHNAKFHVKGRDMFCIFRR